MVVIHTRRLRHEVSIPAPSFISHVVLVYFIFFLLSFPPAHCFIRRSDVEKLYSFARFYVAPITHTHTVCPISVKTVALELKTDAKGKQFASTDEIQKSS